MILWGLVFLLTKVNISIRKGNALKPNDPCWISHVFNLLHHYSTNQKFSLYITNLYKFYYSKRVFNKTYFKIVVFSHVNNFSVQVLHTTLADCD